MKKMKERTRLKRDILIGLVIIVALIICSILNVKNRKMGILIIDIGLLIYWINRTNMMVKKYKRKNLDNEML